MSKAKLQPAQVLPNFGFRSAADIALSPKALAYGRKMVKTKEGALKLLQDAGILDEHGKPTEPYREDV